MRLAPLFEPQPSVAGIESSVVKGASHDLPRAVLAGEVVRHTYGIHVQTRGKTAKNGNAHSTIISALSMDDERPQKTQFRPSHGENRGSSPLGSANKIRHFLNQWFFVRKLYVISRTSISKDSSA